MNMTTPTHWFFGRHMRQQTCGSNSVIAREGDITGDIARARIQGLFMLYKNPLHYEVREGGANSPVCP